MQELYPFWGWIPFKDALEIRRRVGYLAEDQVMFGWMTVAQIIEFMAPFYPTWNAALAAQYLEKFSLPASSKIKHLSKGQNCQLGLLLALAHQPELVILDDPTLGLDPIMRKGFLRDVVEHLQGNDITVFFSSHLLYEIEPIADRVAILNDGQIVREGETEQIRRDVKKPLCKPRRTKHCRRSRVPWRFVRRTIAQLLRSTIPTQGWRCSAKSP